ncbi:MAG TPA: NAD(P)H-dependent oxidoreductase subunit E [Acidimicrobiaceae bacterium]|nr:NAD(P)H-dependent oxidoreductase subunit E [Acidimicrobiaceae bacterium]
MSFFTAANRALGAEIIALYPRARSAVIPLLHLAQEQAGWVSDDAMAEIAVMVDVTSAQVLGTCSFYEMFKREPVGRYLVNVCVTLSCALAGAGELLAHAERRLGVRTGGTTDDGLFTLAAVECQAACTEAPCLQVNYRYRYKVDADGFDALVDELAAGALDDEVPPHGTLARVRRAVAAEREVGAVAPEDVAGAPVWLRAAEASS